MLNGLMQSSILLSKYLKFTPENRYGILSISPFELVILRPENNT